MFYAKVLFIILSLYPCLLNAQNTNLTPLNDVEISQKDGKEYVLDKSGKPFAGSLQQIDEDGRTVTYFYRNGLRNGIAFSYYEDGKIEFQVTYRKGLKDGESMYLYENGKPKLKQSYKQDILSGEELIFYENGIPERKNNYLNGKLDGEIIYFDNKGNKLKIEHYKNGIKEGIEHIIEDNLLKEEHNYINGQIHGISKIYNKDYLSEEIEYKNGIKDGVSKTYLKDGTLIEIPYKNGKKEGIGKAYYPDRVLANTATYWDDTKNGISEKFYKNGIKNTTEIYKNDKLEGIRRTYDEEGNLKKVSYFINGTELATVDIENNKTLQEIYTTYKKGQLKNILSQKYKWYSILWLGLNLESPDILNDLEQAMNMYASKIDDIKVYERESKAQYRTLNRQLFFGLNPLSYAINISASTNILQRFATSSDKINQENERGGTAFIEAIRLNAINNVKFLLLRGAEISKRYSPVNDTVLLYAIKENLNLKIIEHLIEHKADLEAINNDEKTPLLLAVEKNDINLFKLLVNKGAKISNMHIGNLLLYAYLNNASSSILDEIIDYIKNNNKEIINEKDKEGHLVLMEALKKQDYVMVDKLLFLDADVNIIDNSGDNALTYAIYNKIPNDITMNIYSKEISVDTIIPKYKKSILEILLDKKNTNLLMPIFHQLETKKSITQNNSIFVQGKRKEIPFSTIIKQNDIKMFDLAINYATPQELSNNEFIWYILQNKDIHMWNKYLSITNSQNIQNVSGNEKLQNGEILLHYLIKNKYDNSFFEHLLIGKKNSTIYVKDSNNKNSLDLAIEYDNPNLFNILYRESKNIRPDFNNLHLYLIDLPYYQEKMAETIIENGPDLRYIDNQGVSILMSAVKNLHTHLIKLLLNINIDLTSRDTNGNTALMYLSDAIINTYPISLEEKISRFKDIVVLLKNKGLDINTQNGNGETLLIKIAQRNPDFYPKIKDFLIEQGMNSELKDQYGKTAEDYISKTNN